MNKRIDVNKTALMYCLTQWVETFNDCACCPCYPYDCNKSEQNLSDDCAKEICRALHEMGTGAVKPQ